MLLSDALALGKGDVVIHKATAIPYRPIRITDCWHNVTRTIALARLASVDATAWLDLTGYDLPPAQTTWCRTCNAWESKAQRAERHPNDDQQLKRSKPTNDRRTDALHPGIEVYEGI